MTTYDLDIEALKKVKTWREWDAKFTAKVTPGFKTAKHHYSQASCSDQLEHIDIPTLLIHSKDDPICPIGTLPLDECISNKNFITVITRRGGHVCYFHGAGG